jgi:general secretion pathway protein A
VAAAATDPAAAPATVAPSPPPADSAQVASNAALVPASAAEHVPPVSISALLEANAASTTDVAAYRRLLALWGTALPNDRDPCAQAAKAGLACLDQRGSWAQVRVLNRPAILTLNDDKGQRHRVVLRNLDDDTATLVVGERDVRVPLQELSGSWFGEFTVVWKPKTQRPRDLSLGMSGDQVRWLRRSLAALRGAADPDHGDTYDQDLAIAVQNFQRAHRLNVDGVAGIQTQVVLDTALAEPGSPLLLSTAPRGS